MAKIVVRNPNSGSVVIDDTYENLVLKQKGTQTFVYSSPDYNYPTLVIPSVMDGDTPPLVAIRPIGSHEWCKASVAGGYYNSVNNTYYTIVQIMLAGITSSGITSSLTLNWYLFEKADDVSTGTGVVILRNRNTGRVTFDSDLNYMKVVDYYEYTITADNNYPTTIRNYPSDRVYAICQPKVGRYYVSSCRYYPTAMEYEINGKDQFAACRFVSNNLHLSKGYFDYYEWGPGNCPGGTGTYTSLNSSVMVVDVTGY